MVGCFQSTKEFLEAWIENSTPLNFYADKVRVVRDRVEVGEVDVRVEAEFMHFSGC